MIDTGFAKKKVDTRTTPKEGGPVTKIVEIEDEGLPIGGIVSTHTSSLDYSALTPEQAQDFMRYDEQINSLMNATQIGVGKVLAEAQEKYSKNGNGGIFTKWVESKGLNIKKAQRLVNVYKYWDQADKDKKRIIQELPITLAYKITSKKAEESLVEEVLEGKITTNKEYMDKVKLLKTVSAGVPSNSIDAEITEGEVVGTTKPKEVNEDLKATQEKEDIKDEQIEEWRKELNIYKDERKLLLDQLDEVNTDIKKYERLIEKAILEKTQMKLQGGENAG